MMLSEEACEAISMRNLIGWYLKEITQIVEGELGRDVLNNNQLRTFKRQGIFRNSYQGAGTKLVLTDTAQRVYDRLKEEKQ